MIKRKQIILCAITVTSLGVLPFTGCSTMKKVFAVDSSEGQSLPIHNPFGDFYASQKKTEQPMILRTKKGDRSIEVELPRSDQDVTDLSIPMSPNFKEAGDRAIASDGSGGTGLDESYKDRKPTISDREMTAHLPQGLPEDNGRRRDIEQGLGLSPTDDGVPLRDQSYLASMDKVKQLFRSGRYEVALIEMDDLITHYQTDGKLYEMRGTLLDRLGQSELALKSWNQALRFDPKNVKLRRFVERKEQKRSLASP